jgi:hypothetical protein
MVPGTEPKTGGFSTRESLAFTREIRIFARIEPYWSEVNVVWRSSCGFRRSDRLALGFGACVQLMCDFETFNLEGIPHEILTLDRPTGTAIDWFSLVECRFTRKKKCWIMTSDQTFGRSNPSGCAVSLALA